MNMNIKGMFRMQYRTEIDGLRAIAAIPVLLFHAGLSEHLTNEGSILMIEKILRQNNRKAN